MPWDKKSAKEKKKGMTDKEASTWVSVANETLSKCLADGGEQSTCEGKAIKIANSAVNKMKGEQMPISATISGKMRILAEGDPIIEKIIAGNPVLKAVHGSANGKIAVMDALSIGQEGHPSSPDGVRDIIGDGPWVFDREVVSAALPTFFGKPVVVDGEGFVGHGGKRMTVGSIVGAEIYSDDRGEFVRVFPVLWDLEYPEIVDEIKANKDGLSTSFEISSPMESIEVVGGPGGTVKPKMFSFSGSCILKRENAAYPGQNISAVAHSSEAVKEDSFYDIMNMMYETLGQDAYPVELYPSSVIYKNMKDNKYYKAGYSIADGKVELGKAQEVRPTYVKAEAISKKLHEFLSANGGRDGSGALSPDMGAGTQDRKHKINSKGGMKTMPFENIPDDLQDTVAKIVEEAKAAVTASFEATLKEKDSKIETVSKSHDELDKKVSEMSAEINASKKFDLIKASYPDDKHVEIKEVLKKVELKTATSDDVLKLSTEVRAEKKTLTLGSGDDDQKSKWASGEHDAQYGIRPRKTA